LNKKTQNLESLKEIRLFLRGQGKTVVFTIFSLAERLEILEAIGFIDYLVVFSEETPQKIISALLPDVLVKGGDWKPDGIVGRKEVENAGGRVVLIPYLEGQSTSQILSKIFRSSLKTKKGSSSPVGDKEP
jgi:bifunctional ADP-heptose synthase (sugar kinase/adenylyltransferase)